MRMPKLPRRRSRIRGHSTDATGLVGRAARPVAPVGNTARPRGQDEAAPWDAHTGKRPEPRGNVPIASSIRLGLRCRPLLASRGLGNFRRGLGIGFGMSAVRHGANCSV
jgi:hypothetical protein